LSFAREAEKKWRYFSVYISLAGYSPDNNDVSTEAEESPLMSEATASWRDLACSGL
jgi:hypothetical protein